MSKISIIPAAGEEKKRKLPAFLWLDEAAKARSFHETMPHYRPTPLVELPGLAEKLGVGRIFVKDESHRFGLNAFKALGASYAVAKILSGRLAGGEGCLSYEELLARRAEYEDMVFVTATDGNHGKGLAWTAASLGCRAEVYMPKGSQACRAQAIAAIGGTPVIITELNYDDTVRLAFRYAEEKGYCFVQDTGFSGYEDIPNAITQGYTTMAAEAADQLGEAGGGRPTHVFLQAGVGSMAGGVLSYLAGRYGENLPQTVIAEPETVACIYKSVEAREGTPQRVGGNPQTIMAGLNCGEPNPFTWPVLRDFAAFYASCPDWVSEEGMRALANPAEGDEKMISGESGAVGLGLLCRLCQDESYREYRNQLGLQEDSVVLLFSTEGDTDPESYEKIVKRS